MNGRILVTGASGFLGQRLIPALIRAGYDVIAPVRRDQPPQSGVIFAVNDAIETIDWGTLLSGVDGVAHLAGLAHTRDIADERLYDRVNTQATLRLAKACEGRTSRFVFASSIRAMTGPTAEEILDEDSPARPSDAYGRSKLRAEQGLALLQLPTTILRPVVVYGVGAKGNLARLAALADSAAPLPFGALRAARSFLSVDNFINAVTFALTRKEPGAETFVVADPEPSSVAELFTALRSGLGRPAKLAKISPGLLGFAAKIAGQSENWTLLSGPLAVRPRKLLNAGWSPPIASTAEGAALWGERLRAG